MLVLYSVVFSVILPFLAIYFACLSLWKLLGKILKINILNCASKTLGVHICQPRIQFLPCFPHRIYCFKSQNGSREPL